jgi:deoxyribodipyrimidine photo-lyase
MNQNFPPTRTAALARLAAVRPAAYASSRNRLDGAVTALSPYLTHGLLSLPEVAASVAARQALPIEHKLVQELGWREFFQHVWQHHGEAIFESLHTGPRPDADYLPALPDDIRQARTGVPVIDAAVRTLYATGWLHNHARMWLASYVIHVRGVHWRAGADWLVAHLLDGDLASNHLSWQWIAGTGSHKPYLFNAENVARYTAGLPGWASPGSVIDTDYATLERWARGTAALPPAPGRPGPGQAAGVEEPALWHQLPTDLAQATALPARQAVAGREVWLVHPWSLADPAAVPRGERDPLRLGVWPAEFHARWPWSAARWRFVATRMATITSQVLWADSAALQQALTGAANVRCTDNRHLPAAWPAAWRQAAPRLLTEPDRLCSSFSQYWRQASRGITRLGVDASKQPIEPDLSDD